MDHCPSPGRKAAVMGPLQPDAEGRSEGPTWSCTGGLSGKGTATPSAHGTPGNRRGEEGQAGPGPHSWLETPTLSRLSMCLWEQDRELGVSGVREGGRGLGGRAGVWTHKVCAT